MPCGDEMESAIGNRTKVLIVLNLALAAICMYILSVFFARPMFQSTRLTDPLAEIHSLSPLYYIAIILIVLLGISCLVWRIGGKRLHIFLLLMLASMLWLTPYLLTGFTRLPDAPWHVGVAMQMPQVLAGEPVAFSYYAQIYPGSYIYHYSAVSLLGIQPLTYIQFYPLFCLFFFVYLCYVLLTRLFDSRVALLTMLLAIPGLHYLQLHASPHTIGALLMLTSLLLLAMPVGKAKLIAVPTIILIAVSHPTTPILLGIFLTAAFIITAIYSRRVGRTQVLLACAVILCLVSWLPLYYKWVRPPTTAPAAISQSVQTTAPAQTVTPGTTTTPVQTAVPAKTIAPTKTTTPPQTTSPASDLINKIVGNLVPADLGTSQQYLGGTPFIYSGIYTLNKGIYYLYAACGISGVLYILVRTYFKKRNVREWLKQLGGMSRNEALLACSVLPLVVFSLLLAEGAHDLIETGLTYVILAVSGIIASIILRSQWKYDKLKFSFITTVVLFFTLSYPLVAYSIDAYSNTPESEAAGLAFLAEDTPLAGKVVAGAFMSQLALYPSTITIGTSFVNFGVNLQQVDVAVFRNTGYYYTAMRFDLSFTKNRYSEALAAVESGGYDKVYSSPTIEIYLRSKTAK
jgi:hypothetical protein